MEEWLKKFLESIGGSGGISLPSSPEFGSSVPPSQDFIGGLRQAASAFTAPAGGAGASDGEWSKVSKYYNDPVDERMRILQSYTGQSSPLTKDVYGPDAVWMTRSGTPIGEGQLLKLIELSQNPIAGQFVQAELQKYLTPTRATSTGTPAYVSAAQADNYRASAELARAQAADIPARREQERQQLVIEEAKRKFGEGAQLIGLQTNNQDLANRGSQIVFDQSNAIAQARNRIQELNVQQGNLQQQYNYNTSAANAAAANAAAQFNAQMGFNVEQANVAAQQRKQEQLQSLARDISEAAKAPGDYGKLAALTLANAGWGAPNTAIGKGEDLRTAQSMAPLESQLRTRQDVMSQPERPFSYTPITPNMVQAPVIAPVDVSKFAIPEQTMTTADVSRQKREGLAAIAGLGSSSGAMSPGAYMSNLASQLQSGASSADVNAQLNAAIANQIKSLPGPQGESGGVPAAAEGGIVPRYEDGGVNDNPFKQNPDVLFKTLIGMGADPNSAASMVSAVLNSDVALASNTAAKAASDAEAAARAAQPVYRPAPQRMTDASNDTEAQLLRLGMEQPYQQPMSIEQVANQMPPAMYQPASGGYYAAAGGAAPAVAGQTTQSGFNAAPSAVVYNPLQDYIDRLRGAARKDYGYSQSYDTESDPINRLVSSIFNQDVVKQNPFEQYLLRLRRAARKEYATGGIAPGAYISGERGPELNIPLGDKTIVLNQKQMKAAGIDLKKLMSGSKKPEQFADGGIFDAGWGNVQDQDRTLSMQFLNDALARARAGTPFQEGALPAPVYASTPGFSPLVTQVLGSLTSMAQGVPTEYFQELAAKYRPSGIRESVTQRSA